jgi:hypothetical protein
MLSGVSRGRFTFLHQLGKRMLQNTDLCIESINAILPFGDRIPDQRNFRLKSRFVACSIAGG